ncbi:ABC transporter substrate-binding protein [Sphaerochaeta sp. S2]|uniref:ABC transporter substrate-binding protein n=1 Tax=Sphaerochaeta sp. S2 TaxID=2798868 RepID=UPI0018E9B3F2|nr:extracellular solute-binding protein [Sphaerochaeta sp. S2]MBJ2354925.1 extracellular solute-binding protein [Sphaerochaeta sp. S2]
MRKFTTVLVMLCISMMLLSGAGTKEQASPAKKVTLNVMMSFPRFTEEMEAYVAQFEAKMLEEKGIEVEVELEMPSSDQYRNILQTRLSSNDAPDLFTLHATADLPTYVEAGYVADLSSQPLAAKLYPDVRTSVSVDEKVYAVPFESTVWGYLYNKDIFEACGITAPDTLDEMKEVVRVLKQNGYTPFQLAFQEQWVPQLMTALLLGGKVSGEIPDWVDRMYADQGSYREVADIFEMINLVMSNGTPRAMETGSEQGAADFANGKAAMYIQGTWSAESILSVNPEIRIGVGALPVNNNEDCTRVNLATTTSLAVYADTPQKEMAMEFANYILDDKDSSALYESLKFNPVASCHDYDQYDWAKDASRYVAEGRAYMDLVLPQAVTNEQGKLLQSLYVKQVTVDQFITIMDQTFKAANKALAQ